MGTLQIKQFYQLTKPGVLYGNVLTVAAGFLYASRGSVHIVVGVMTILGMALVIAAACVLNNYLDQDIDAIMVRTKKRPSVSGDIKGSHMVIFSVALGVSGIGILYGWTNRLVPLVAALGFVVYVWLYGALSKRRSIHGTLVGSISGALPIVAGYAAVSGRVDTGMMLVFLMLFFWQFAEFYPIAIYRRAEYAAAKVPVMPVVVGVRPTVIQIFIYTILYVASTVASSLFSYTGWVYAGVMLLSGAYWIYVAARGFTARDADAWARRMFRLSMLAILLLCVMLSVGPLLP